MRVTFQLLDCDYIMLGNSPVVRLFGKTKEGKTVCAFYKNYFPYFYILPKKSKSKIEDFLKQEFNSQIIHIEEVEKFLPLGYQKEKTKLIKLTLRDPSKVPEIRENIKREGMAEDIFEADILFKYRFMSDFDLSGFKWIEVSGDSINTITVKTDLVIAADAIEKLEEEENAPLKYMALDIETISEKEDIPDSKKDPIIIISLSFFPPYKKLNSLVLTTKSIKADKSVICFTNEKEMLEEFSKIIELFDPDIIVGYNINNFDFPYILDRLRENKISLAIGRCKQKQCLAKKIGAKYRNSIVGRTIVDVYDLIKESIQKGSLRLKRLGLGDVSKAILNEDKVDIAHSEIKKYWNGTEDQVKKLIDYARKDSELVMKLLLEKNMLDKFFALTKVSGVLLQDCLDGGETTRVENLLLKEFNKKDFVLPCKPDDIKKRIEEKEKKELKGALVLEPKIGLHTNCIVYLDFHAMYPSIFISYNICPTTLLLTKENVETIKTPYGVEFVSSKVREGLIPGILKYLMNERDKVKAQMKTSKNELEKRNLDAKQYALKVMANAFYGYTGYLKAKLYTLDIANSITSCGRMLINKTKEIFETKVPDCEVVYGDTDSIMIKTKTTDLDEAFEIGKDLENIINKELKGIVKMKIEHVFKTLLILSKKRYAGLSYERVDGNWHEEIIMKGIETVRRDWCDLTTKTLFEVLNIILKEQNTKKAFQFVKDVMIKLQNNQIPIEDLVITKSISKSLTSYKGVQPHIELVKKMKQRSPTKAPGVGDRVSFVIVKGLQLISDRAEDPDWVKKHGLQIDAKYYIESQILPPLERVFEVIGISKLELVGMGKQLVLSEAIRNHLKTANVLNISDGFICNKCNQIYRRPPLVGRCLNCQGELLFVSNGTKAKYLQCS